MAGTTEKARPDRSFVPNVTAARILTNKIRLQFLSENRGLAPADNLQRREAILVDDAEMLLGLAEYFFAGNLFKAEQDFKKRRGRRRSTGNV